MDWSPRPIFHLLSTSQSNVYRSQSPGLYGTRRKHHNLFNLGVCFIDWVPSLASIYRVSMFARLIQPYRSKNASGWCKRSAQNEIRHSPQTLLDHTYCFLPRYTQARSTFWLVEHSRANWILCRTFAFVLLDLPLALLVQLSWVTVLTITFSFYLSSFIPFINETTKHIIF